MNTRARIIENANKRLLMEDLPPTIYFSEHEVLKMMCDLIDYDLGGKEEIPPKLLKIFQDGLKAKGRNLDVSKVPDGAMM